MFIESVGILHSYCIGPSPIFVHNEPSASKISGEQGDALRRRQCTHSPSCIPLLHVHIALISWGNQTEVDNYLILCLQEENYPLQGTRLFVWADFPACRALIC